MKSGTTPKLFTRRQAAEALNISERKLWSMTQAGEIASIRLGRCVRYPERDLDEWINLNKKGGETR